MNFNQNKSFFAGLIGGVLVSLVLALLFNALGVNAPSKESAQDVARVGQDVLTRDAARSRVADKLIPIENDRYRVLNDTVKEWVNEELINKEAKAKNQTVSDFYQSELWTKVRVTMDDVTAYYQKHRAKYPQDLASAKKEIFNTLRNEQFQSMKQQLLDMLAKKYDAKILLQKPDNYVQGLAMPAAANAVPVPAAPAEKSSAAGEAPVRGPANAPVTIEEFADFECVYCHKVQPALKQVLQKFSGKVRLIFRNFPLSSTPGQGSFLAHEAAACAQEQGKFWEYYDKLFSDENAPDAAALDQMATDLGLDMTKFKACLAGGTYRDMIKADKQEGTQKGVQGTPTFFINGKKLAGAVPANIFEQAVNAFLHPTAAGSAAAMAAQKTKNVPLLDLPERPSKGTPGSPVTIVEFSDFFCPFCQRVEPTINKLMQQYDGKIKRVWRHFPLPMHVGSERAHQAAECAHEQGKFWEYHDKLFEKLGQYKSDEALEGLAKELGLNEGDFKDCLTSNRYEQLVKDDIGAGQALGVRGTPAFFVNGIMISGAQPYENFKQRVDAALNPGQAAVQPPTPAPAAQPAANPNERVEFKKFDKNRIQGPNDAPVTLVEFSDFHCPFCRRAEPTISKLMKDYDGKIRRVWEHFPLSIHPGADRTHEASQCAAEQGKFWKFHDLVMAGSAPPSGDEQLENLAKKSGVNMKKFKKCFNGDEVKAVIKSDIDLGSQSGVRGTPTFFINGIRVRGAQPYASFKSLIDTELDKKS